MRIAFAVRDRKNFIGGPAADTVRLLTALKARGYDVHVLGFWVGKEKAHANFDAIEKAGIPCRIVRKQSYTEDGVRWILEQIRDIRPDIFMAGLSTEGCFAARWLHPAGIPVVNSLYGNDDVNLGRAVWFSECSPKWRVSGHAVFGETLLKRLRDKTKVHLPAISVYGVVEVPPDYARRSDTQIFSIVYAGRLVERQKRTGDMIRAFISIAESYVSFQFHLIGDSVDDERMQYEQMVKDHNLQKRIFFHGILHGHTYYTELARHQVIILLSDTEGIPGSVIDGMAVGLVPVCLRYPGVEDMIKDGENGLIVEDRGIGLESALVRLSSNPALWHHLSCNARECIESRFAKGHILDKWEKFLHTITMHASSRKEIEIPRRIRLPRKSKLLVEDRRKPGLWKKIRKKIPGLPFLCVMLCLMSSCNKKSAGDTERIRNDKDAALHHLKKKLIEKPFDAYHLENIPGAAQCQALLDEQGVFTDAITSEKFYRENLDSFYTGEMASFDYSRFLVHQLSRLWNIAEQYRGKRALNPNEENLRQLLHGIVHYGALELDRPGNRFQHKYSDFQISAIAINMFFCLYPLMEEVRMSGTEASELQHDVYRKLTAMGKESWSVPQKHDSTDIQPFQLARFTGHTWWINGNTLTFRPAYPCALMMHSVEMVDIIVTLVGHAIVPVSPTTVDTAFWRENITPDGAVWTYGRQNRPWSYPYRGIASAVERIADFKGTPWEMSLTTAQLDVLMEFIRRSSFFHYKGFIPPCLDRQNFNALGQIPQDVPSRRLADLLLRRFPEALTAEQKQELQSFVEHAQVREQTDQVEFDSNYAGTRYYYCQDDLIRKTQDYYVYVNMASRRVDGVESAVQYADVHNYFSADGATFFMRTGDEYQKAMGAFELTAHPGVTARYGDEELIPGRNLMGHCSMHDYAAGLVTELGSCAGFIFEKMRGIDKYKHWALEDTLFENDQEWLYGVKANKSFFWFGDQFVALGSGITNRRPELGSEIRTTIDQSLIRRTIHQEKELSAKDTTATLLKSAQANSLELARIENNGFVYQILPEQTPGEVWVKLASRPTRWNELNILNHDVPDKSQHADIFQLWINHGNHPEDDRYGYVVYCGDGEVPPVPRVLMNTTHIQAVASMDCAHIQALFYVTDTLHCDELLFHVSAPCAFSVLLDDSKAEFTVSDAQIDINLESIVITTNLALNNATRIKELYQVRIALPNGIYRGKQASDTLRITD